MALLLDGKATAAAWRGELKERIEALRERTGVVPGLAVVMVGDDPASAIYVRNKNRAAAEAGIHSQIVGLPADTGQEDLREKLAHLATDPRVHGMLVQLPLPAGYDATEAQELVPPAKDVDCLHPWNQGLLALGRPRFVPATPLGILELLRRHDLRVSGAHVVVIGRSAIVGRPLATLLASRAPHGDATVTLCHSRTRGLAEISRQADILVAATGQPGLVRADMVRPGATVIDVGTNRVPSSEEGKTRLVGDVDFSAVSEVAGAITPVPGGVGPMTVAALVYNTLRAAFAQIGHSPDKDWELPAAAGSGSGGSRW
jgi:methylenetetrahydrofolate dehydrogenase (NADP+)/methenyltetrahydrofolate cyclohydrolase